MPRPQLVSENIEGDQLVYPAQQESEYGTLPRRAQIDHLARNHGFHRAQRPPLHHARRTIARNQGQLRSRC
jgi:hypothetical protein